MGLFSNDVVVPNFPVGMGDQFWYSPAVAALVSKFDRVFIPTAWPQYWKGMNKVYCLHPDQCPDQGTRDILGWPVYKENWEAVSPDHWADFKYQEIVEGGATVYHTGIYGGVERIAQSTDLPLPDKLHLYMPHDSALLATAQLMIDRATRQSNGDAPQVFLHIPTNGVGLGYPYRWCTPDLFAMIYTAFKDRVAFYDFGRVATESARVIEIEGLPVFPGTSHTAPLMWAAALCADAVVTTDNHMLPIALAAKVPILYLGAGVSRKHLLDPRVVSGPVIEVWPDDTDHETAPLYRAERTYLNPDKVLRACEELFAGI